MSKKYVFICNLKKIITTVRVYEKKQSKIRSDYEVN